MELPVVLKYARYFATKEHGEQTYMMLPYVIHLMAVEATAREFGALDPNPYHNKLPAAVSSLTELEDNFYAACWLHDLVEDTRVKLRDIREQFGADIARLVGAVTSEPGVNRKTRNALTYPKALATGQRAVRLKLCDRIANVSNGGEAMEMYRSEHAGFRRALYVSGANEDMWEHLDGLLGL